MEPGVQFAAMDLTQAMLQLPADHLKDLMELVHKSQNNI